MTEQAFNPFDANQVQDAWPRLRELRAAGPVARIGEGMHYSHENVPTYFEYGPRSLPVLLGLPA